MSAKQCYEYYEKFLKETSRIGEEAIAKFLLKMPIPMSYELWTYLHSFIDGDDVND